MNSSRLEKIALITLIIFNLLLNIYGNSWGLPSRWHSDEKVANALHMLNKKSLVDMQDFFFQPTGYQIILSAWLVPYLFFLKLSSYPFNELKEAASVSWAYMAQRFPDFATNIYLFSRTLSAIFGALSVYLIYLLASRVYSRRTGLFSAAFLSVSMGFVGTNHFAKYSSLVNLLIILTLLCCIIALDRANLDAAKKYFYFSSFLAGAAISVKFNATLLLPPLLLTYIFIFGIKNSLSVMVRSGFLFLVGFLLLTPSFVTRFKDYLYSTGTLLNVFSLSSAPANSEAVFPIYMGTINYFFELALIFGVPIFILVLGGIGNRVLNFKGITKKEIVIFSFILAYWSVMAMLSRDVYPQTKHIIAIAPLLIIFAGKAMSDIFDFKRLTHIFKSLIFLGVFLFSLAYTYEADLVFLKGDTRYDSTKWILENIPSGSRIEIFSQLHLVCEDKILNDYEIMFLGQSSKNFEGGNLPRWINIEGREKYIELLNKNGSSGDYIIINLNYLEKLYSGDYLGYLPGLSEYVKGLFEGKHNFILVKKFVPKNRKIVFGGKGNLILPENILWDPIPDYEAVSPTIYVFKRAK